MKVHFIQHVPFEPPGFLLEWAEGRGDEISFTHFYLQNAALPDTLPYMLVVMGGPMGVYDTLPWLEAEKAYISDAINAGVKVLGICLGAQLIANVLGAEVYPHSHKEIGWWPVTLTKEGLEHDLFDHFPEQHQVLHWHGDTFDLPDDATLLATSAACRHQAFINETGNAIGLQYHIEVDEIIVEGFVENGGGDLNHQGEWVQKKHQILPADRKVTSVNKENLLQLLDKWVDYSPSSSNHTFV